MNYVTQTLMEIYSERFAHDKPFLSEKIEELEKHRNKYDGLTFLCCSADETTVDMYAERTKLTIEEISFLRSIWCKI